MHMVDCGRGTPLVFIPGLQGRWEYTAPTIQALAEHFRVITFSLDDAAQSFDAYGDQVAEAMQQAQVARAAICGLSFGGLVALNFASRFPDRTAALVVASAPGPGWRLRRRHELYARVPWIFGPLFMMEIPFRTRPELKRALPLPAERRAFARTMLRIAVGAPPSLAAMARRARQIGSYDVAPACARITAPTLIVTGEPELDHVVRVEGTSQYGRLIAGAKTVILDRTGHQGSLTRPAAFAEIVREFVTGARHAAA